MRPWVAQRYTYVLADRFLRAFEYIQFAAGLPCSIKPPPAESGPGAPPRSGPLGVQSDEKCCPCRLIPSEVQPSAFTDFQNKRPHSRDALRPSFADRSPSTNAEGAGKAGWPHAPGAPAQKIARRAREPQVQAETLRPSLRDGLRLIRDLPGEPAFATVARASSSCTNLAPDLGAPGPHVSILKGGERS